MATDRAVETERDEYLLAQVREVFGRVVYSHKTHEKQADLCFRKHRGQQAALVVFTAASAGTFLAALLGKFVSQQNAGLVTSFIALIVTALTLATKSFKFGEESEAHRDIAARLWDVRESYLSLIADIMSGATSAADARERRDKLQEATRAAYADAPRTTSKAFGKAQNGLKNNEELTFASREIDLLLPEPLRLDGREAAE
jgi:hypothetical protein